MDGKSEVATAKEATKDLTKIESTLASATTPTKENGAKPDVALRDEAKPTNGDLSDLSPPSSTPATATRQSDNSDDSDPNPVTAAKLPVKAKQEQAQATEKPLEALKTLTVGNTSSTKS